LTTDLAAKAITAGKLSQFAATTSAELAGVISNETGTGSLVFGTSPTLTTSVLGGNTFSAFATTDNLTVGESAGYTDVDATSNVLSGGSITGSTANAYVTDNYSVRNLVSNFNDLTHTINIGTGTVTNNSNYADKYINIGTGVISGGNTYIYLGASGATVNLSGTVSLPSTTSIGSVSSTEIGYVDGVTSAIQTQLDSKQRLVAKLTSATSAIANTETRIIGFTAAANSIVAGDTFRFTGYATRAGANAATTTLRIRIGTTTLTGNAPVSLTTTATTTGVYKFEALVTVRTAGSSGTVGGVGKIDVTTTAGGNSFTTAVALNTTVANQVEATIISGNASNNYTFEYATLEKLPA
jgi:plastocyanin